MSSAEATKAQSCRSCGGAPPRRFLSLGPTPITNRLVRSDAAQQAEFTRRGGKFVVPVPRPAVL